MVPRLFVEVDQKQISIHEMENNLLQFRTTKENHCIQQKKKQDLTIVIPSDQTSDRTS